MSFIFKDTIGSTDKCSAKEDSAKSSKSKTSNLTSSSPSNKWLWTNLMNSTNSMPSKHKSQSWRKPPASILSECMTTELDSNTPTSFWNCVPEISKKSYKKTVTNCPKKFASKSSSKSFKVSKLYSTKDTFIEMLNPKTFSSKTTFLSLPTMVSPGKWTLIRKFWTKYAELPSIWPLNCYIQNNIPPNVTYGV